ncbi:carboxymuconolactone decarboxylase family protein [Polyangium jinanense]|uniref:Carboxymuconolactone decarboxylase family protein n=1 Tax=Polyangium jinanense TaxID=2829994 RepID=A0A9X3XBP2_9BACT|nr:carboxymuconolactone decarboxylase family protein [Polyangium jinanense]MDC3959224.1 carboxymuconolactone decarboxylase family protein [Polyangium jinanense]MDC3987684.1 carboxymuconolactone decarboxylase family protein [Polyangium jinanense]
MQARLKNPATLVPEAMQPIMTLVKSLQNGKIPPRTLGLVHARISQINGCAVCLDMHARQEKKGAEPDDRLLVLAGWRDAPYFTEAERAALALAEAETRLADRADAVPDDVWNEAARHFDEQALAQLVLYIGLINMFNRVNVTTRQVAGAQSW